MKVESYTVTHVAGKADIAATFLPAQNTPNLQLHAQTSASAQADRFSEDLFVMTADGGLVRHSLRLVPNSPVEATQLHGDR